MYTDYIRLFTLTFYIGNNKYLSLTREKHDHRRYQYNDVHY